jgi:hypothetical protein
MSIWETKRTKETGKPRLALLRARDSLLVLPAEDPYDLDLVFAAAEAHTRLHGQISLQIAGMSIRLLRRGPDRILACLTCSGNTHPINYIVRSSVLCGPCARSSLRFAALNGAQEGPIARQPRRRHRSPVPESG